MASYENHFSSFMLFLTSLPAELQLHIWNQLPSLWSVVALRLTCRTFNDFYTQHAQVIRRAQRDKIVFTITYWYNTVIRPHKHGLHCDEDNLDTTMTGWAIRERNNALRKTYINDNDTRRPDWWDVNKQRTDFTHDVKDFLPWPRKGSTQYVPVWIAPGTRLSDWRIRDRPKQNRHHMEYSFDGTGVNTRACVNLTGGRSFMLDTMHAWIYHSREENEQILIYRWDLYKFVGLQVEWAVSHPYLYLDHERVEPDSLEDSEVPLEEIQALRSVLARSEWPQNLDEPTKSYIEQWWVKNKTAYNRLILYGDFRPSDSYTRWLYPTADKLTVHPMPTLEERRRPLDYTYALLQQPYCGMVPGSGCHP